jgi:zinc protease
MRSSSWLQGSIPRLAALSLAISLLIAALPLALSHAANGVFPFPYTQEDLPNGLRLITVPTDAKNLVTVMIVVQTGSRNEVEPGKSGFAHLFEHLMFRGTELYPPQKYDAVLTKAGAASNAFTTADYTAFHTTFSKEDLPQILSMESDRFQNLDYDPETFKTETGAVLGEFNKDASDQAFKLNEVVDNAAFDQHTYKHTTMGFLKDVQDMPNQYDYSKQFFERYYRPEYTTIVVVGDVNQKTTRPLVDQYWGNWKRGSYHADIPVEPPQTAARENHVDWPAQTLPLIDVAFHAPGSVLAFSDASDLYDKLVIREQKVDSLEGELAPRVDPGLFEVYSRVKHPQDVQYVRDQILATVRQFQTDLVPADKLAAVLSRERYSFILSLDNTLSVADTVAEFVALRRTPDTIDKVYALYGQLTAEDIRAAAQKYLTDNNRTIVTLTGTGGAK